MPQLTQRVVNTFIKGLVTEAGELTFPENASVDELNCELFRDGSRRRRKGIAFEEGSGSSSFSVLDTTVMNFGEWANVGNQAGKTYLVVQAGAILYFYDKNAIPYSTQEKPHSVSLVPYQATGGPSVYSSECQFSSTLGNLVVVSPAIEPIYISEASDGTLNVTLIKCRVRDFEWLGDKSTYDEGIVSPSAERKYDTYNTGWVGTLGNAALTSYIASEGEYPPLTHPWYSGKNASGVFSVAEWLKVYTGTSLIGNGHYLYSLFEINRETVSGITGLGNEVETTRFSTVTTFSGRAFFSGLSSSKNTGKIYYSQILQDIGYVGDFFQTNDPTSEVISDLLETDGGVIVLPEAVNIKKLYAFRNSIFAFAENGVWQITGVDNAFSSTAYSVSKLSEMGIVTAGSFTAAEGVPFWWSQNGIHTLNFDDFGNASEVNLSIDTIQTFWNGISVPSKETVKAQYDRINKKILWLYQSDSESISNKYNKVLLLDVNLQAFYPWTISDEDSTTDYILGMAYYTGFGVGDIQLTVVDSSSNDVVVGLDNVVTTQLGPLSNSAISIVFMVRDRTSNKMSMAIVDSDTFLDWGTSDFTSYAETGYDFAGDLVLQKTAPSLTVFLRETETGWEGDDIVGYTPLKPSSILFSAYWDFKKAPSSTPQQGYKRRQMLMVDSEDLTSFQSPSTVLTTRLKVRGRGRSMRIRMESETGKDFIYLGHSLVTEVSSRF